MELSKKVKTALDEARVLILGAQILLGFAFRGPFSDGFERLSRTARALDGLALVLMVLAVGLLIAPGPYHRIVEGGEDSRRLHRFVSAIAGLALLPFALALGLDVFVTAGLIFGRAGGAAAGSVATALAFGLWYGLPHLSARHAGEQERAMSSRGGEQRAGTPLHAKIEQMLTEARVVLPGAQAIFGFQLAIVLTEAFQRLPGSSQAVHATSLFLVALAVMLLMAPAAYHRIVYAGEDTEDVNRTGSVFLTAATVPLAFGLAGDVYVVIAKIAGSPAIGLVTAALALLLLLGLWHIYPLVVARRRARCAALIDLHHQLNGNSDRGG
ncbi:MAG: hypothetical protein JO047_15455 [Alphaproteobacteria bacterium]|nr:hypothetical protein [Alphaproteobacteria bacterium]